jgi:RNA recognition motif-containing protein
MNLFVAKLSPATTSEDLNDLFGDYGDVISAKVIMDRETGTSKLFGFVEMKEEEAAQRAIKELNECLFDNSAIVVKKARPKGESTGRSNFGDRDRSRGRSRSGYGN